MATKAELEADHERYAALVALAHEAAAAHRFSDAVGSAVEALGHADGMMQYGRRWNEQTFTSLEAVDIILRCAPVLLDRQSIDAVEDLLKKRRRVERDTSANLGERVAHARSRLGVAYRMWSELEKHDTCDFRELCNSSGDATQCREIADDWVMLQLAEWTRTRALSLRSQLHRIVRAKCFLCGMATEAPMGMFLVPSRCPRCQQEADFVLSDRQPTSEDQ